MPIFYLLRWVIRGFVLAIFVGYSSLGLARLYAQTPNTALFSTPRYAPLVTAVPFVGMSADPRIGAMGNAGIGAKVDANSTFWNIAKTPLLEKQIAAGINYSPLYTTLQMPDMFLLNFTGTYQSPQGAISVFGKYMNVGKIDLTDVNGEPLQVVRPTEFYVGVGYAIRFSKMWSIGIGAKYIRSNLLPQISNIRGSGTFRAGQAFALDIGVNYIKEIKPNAFLQWGVNFSNMGNKLSYGALIGSDENHPVTGSNFLPANLGIGVGYQQKISEEHEFSASLDINKLLVPARPRNTLDANAIQAYNSQNVIYSWIHSFADAPNGFKEELMEINLSAGGEYNYNHFLALRTGFFLQSRYKGAKSFYSIGLGLNYKMLQFNLSYFVPFLLSIGPNTSPLANTLNFGILVNFMDKPEND